MNTKALLPDDHAHKMPKHSKDLRQWICEQADLNKMYIHDFKNPVSAISANISYLKSVLINADEDVKEAVSDMSVAANLLLFMFDNNLMISQLENGEHYEVVAAPLDQIIAQSVKTCRDLTIINEHPIEMAVAIPDVLCEWEMKYAKLAIDNMLMSSIINAPRGDTITFRVLVENELVTITVNDNGAPINETYLDDQLERTFQLQAKNLEDARYSRAMGMYAVKLAAKFLGGTARIENHNQKSYFILELPQTEQ